ncbi:MAG: FtsX-like permease family protein [Chloroherpetonaceae bacterium]|nr:FtsX-like permease family protein [Chloroherpetonaceae bacterium]
MVNFKIFYSVILRHSFQDPIRFLISILGVAIGVGVLLSIRISNYSALTAFESTIDYLSGKANLQVISKSNTSFDEEEFGKLSIVNSTTPIVSALTPVIESVTTVTDTYGKKYPSPFTILGIDVFTDEQFRIYSQDSSIKKTDFLRFLAEPNTIILPTSLINHLGLEINEKIIVLASGKKVQLQVVGVYNDALQSQSGSSGFGVMDIEQAQRLFDKQNKIDRIDLIINEDKRGETEERLLEIIPSSLQLISPKNRGSQIATMIKAFELNLTALAFISLLVAMFLIYNTILTNAIRRRREVGILRALGLSGEGIFSLFLFEAFLIGCIGSAFGVIIGKGLAHFLLDGVTQTISTLYIALSAKKVVWTWQMAFGVFSLGVVMSVLASIYPAMEVFKIHPRECFHLQIFEDAASLNLRKLLPIGLVIGLVSLLSGFLPSINGLPVFGYVSAICIIFSFAVISPAFIYFLINSLSNLFKKLFGIEAFIAGKYLIESLNRSSTAVNALMVSVAMLVGVSIMVGSFRTTVNYWVEQTLTSDIFFAPAERYALGSQLPIDRSVIDFLQRQDEVKSVEAFSSKLTSYQNENVVIVSTDFRVDGKELSVLLKEGNKTDVFSRMTSGRKNIIISEAFSTRFQKHLGDSIVLQTPKGELPFSIVGVQFDYSSDRGIIFFQREDFTDVWKDSSIHNIAVKLKASSKLEEVLNEWKIVFYNTAVKIYSNKGLRDNVLEIFDQTFAVTNILKIIALVISALAIITSLGAIVFERRFELGVQQAIGTANHQVFLIIILEALFLGSIAAILGILCGIGLSLILVYVINIQSFGWTIQYELPIETLIVTFISVVATAGVSGFAPAKYATSFPLSIQLRRE